MKMPDENLEAESEVEILQGILSELQDLNASIARIDERSQSNRTNLNKLREDRIVPVEKQADDNSKKARRNSLILGAAISIIMIVLGAGMSYGFSLL